MFQPEIGLEISTDQVSTIAVKGPDPSLPARDLKLLFYGEGISAFESLPGRLIPGGSTDVKCFRSDKILSQLLARYVRLNAKCTHQIHATFTNINAPKNMQGYSKPPSTNNNAANKRTCKGTRCLKLYTTSTAKNYSQ